MTTLAPPTSSPRTAALWTLAFVLPATIINTSFLLFDCPFDLAGDEAHYWEWSRQLDWSYYSKGPLVAYIIAAGRWLLGEWSISRVGNEMLAVRLPAVFLSVLTMVGIATLAWRVTRKSSVVAAALGITVTMPIFAVGAKLMTIDAPLMALWVWTLVLVHAGLRGPSVLPWLGAGVLIALGILAKYNMLLLFPAVLITVVVSPELRVYLRRPGPYLATLIGMLGFGPILYWNAQNNWVSFRHVAGQAGVAGESSLNLAGPFEYVGGQLAVVNAFWFIGLCVAVVLLWRRPTAENEQQTPWETRLLIVAAAMPFIVFLGFSPLTKIQPNWPVTGLAAGVIVLALWIRRRWLTPMAGVQRQMRLYLWGGAGFGLLAIFLLHNTVWLMPLFKYMTRNAPEWELTPVAQLDPTARLRGWQELGRGIARVIGDIEPGMPEPFILTDNYQLASQIAFYVPQFKVTCASAVLGGRHSQYDLWPNPIDDPNRFIGRPVIYVGSRKHAALDGDGDPNRAALPGLREGVVIEYSLAGARLQYWTVWIADSFEGFDPEFIERREAY